MAPFPAQGSSVLTVSQKRCGLALLSSMACSSIRRIPLAARYEKHPRRAAEGVVVSECKLFAKGLLRKILQRLERANLDDATRRLGLENRFHLGERVDALASLGGRLVDHHDLHEARNGKHARPLLAYGRLDLIGQRFKNRLHLLARKLSARGDSLNDFALAGGFSGHRAVLLL